jgi:hypothetical protein
LRPGKHESSTLFVFRRFPRALPLVSTKTIPTAVPTEVATTNPRGSVNQAIRESRIAFSESEFCPLAIMFRARKSNLRATELDQLKLTTPFRPEFQPRPSTTATRVATDRSTRLADHGYT